MRKDSGFLCDLRGIGAPAEIQGVPEIHIGLHREDVFQPDDRHHGRMIQELDLGLSPQGTLLIGVQLQPGLFDQIIDTVHFAVSIRIRFTEPALCQRRRAGQ